MQSDRGQTIQVSASLPTDTNSTEKFEYWKKSPDKFLEEIFGIKLFWYQKILLKIIAKEKKYVSIIK
jgi:hypothetical protein